MPRSRGEATGFHTPILLRTDAAGTVRLDPAPPGPFHLRIDGVEEPLGPFDLPAGAAAGEVTVRVD